MQYFKLLDILGSSHVFKGSRHEETFIERSKYFCQAGGSEVGGVVVDAAVSYKAYKSQEG